MTVTNKCLTVYCIGLGLASNPGQGPGPAAAGLLLASAGQGLGFGRPAGAVCSTVTPGITISWPGPGARPTARALQMPSQHWPAVSSGTTRNLIQAPSLGDWKYVVQNSSCHLLFEWKKE